MFYDNPNRLKAVSLRTDVGIEDLFSKNHEIVLLVLQYW